MDRALPLDLSLARDNQRIGAEIAAQAPRLRAFVRRQIADLADAEDIVQDTLFELVAAYRLLQPVEHVAAWLRRVARNRVVDRFRARAREATVVDNSSAGDCAAEPGRVIDDWLAAVGDGPEAGYAREVLARELDAAIADLPPAQRAVFVAHEFDGTSFKDLAAATGASVNTLLGRKHAAVRYLRQRLQVIYNEWTERG